MRSRWVGTVLETIMLRPFCVLLLAGLAAPSLAQSINPAVEGDGAQTQTLEVLDGSVSVSVQSQGSLSLGRGDPDASAGATLAVNGISVGIGKSDENTSSTTREREGAIESGSVTAPNSGSAAKGTREQCDYPMADAAAIDEAIVAGVPVIIRSSDCAYPDAAIERVFDATPRLAAALAQAGLGENQVVSITIADEGVIIYRSVQR